MIISVIALILFIGLVSVTLLGGRLRRLLPAEQLNDESKDAVKLALGLVATMTAILLGLLISSATSGDSHGATRRGSRAGTSAGGFIGFKAVADRARNMACGDLLWI